MKYAATNHDAATDGMDPVALDMTNQCHSSEIDLLKAIHV